MEIEEDVALEIPEWVVTFGDMMSLLLTFFIMLVSLSEIKDEEKFQAVVESMHRRFGHDNSMASLVPGDMKPRNSDRENIATQGRASRFSTESGGDKTRAPVGDFSRVRIIRSGTQITVGTAITFGSQQYELIDAHREALALEVEELAGKPQKIEIRGHTSTQPIDPSPTVNDHWGLAYQRCHETMKFLVQQGIDPRRIRISVAGPYEPMHNGVDAEQMHLNSRVEVFLLDELADLSTGGDEEEKGESPTPPSSETTTNSPHVPE